MASEAEAFLETLKALRRAEARARSETDPARRRVLVATREEWQGALVEARRELQEAAERGGPEAAALLDQIENVERRRLDRES